MHTGKHHYILHVLKIEKKQVYNVNVTDKAKHHVNDG